MINEDYVSFETSKLLKEKGFDEKCISVYHDGKLQLVSSLGIFCGEGYGEQILTYTNSECEWSPIMISAPTLQMAMKWLREVHDLHIDIFVTYKDGISHYQWSVDNLKTQDTISETPCCIAYEQACEAAIRYSLQNLI